MQKTFCDHCGKEITGFHDYTDYSIEFEGDDFCCDLCSDCKQLITEEIERRLNEFIGGGNG